MADGEVAGAKPSPVCGDRRLRLRTGLVTAIGACARGELFIAGQAAVPLGQLGADAIDRFADRPREAVDDLLRRELLQVGDRFGPQELEDLPGFVVARGTA